MALKTQSAVRAAAALLCFALLSACSRLRLPESNLLRFMERSAGRIVYAGLDGNIYTMNQTGEDVRALTTDAGDSAAYYYPAWSPDAKRVAFVGYSKTDGEPPVAVFVANSDGSGLNRIFSNPDLRPFYLYWLPDSKRVSMLSGSASDNNYALNVVDADGGAAVSIGRGRPYYWAWAPDSSALVSNTGSRMQEPADGKLSVATIATGIEAREVGAAPAYFRAPAYSPDGKFVVLAIDDNGTDTLVLRDSESGKRQVLARTSGGAAAFEWSADGEHLAFLDGGPAEAGPLGTLNIFDFSNPAAPVLAKAIVDKVLAFYWDPAGERIAYLSPRIVPAAAGEEGQRMLLSLSIMTADTQAVVEIANFEPAPAFMSQILPHFDQYQRSGSMWSPNSRFLVVNAMYDGKPAIYAVDTTGTREPDFLVEGQFAFWSGW